MAFQRPRHEVADVVRAGSSCRSELSLSYAQARVIENIAACRTAVLGGHIDECDTCDLERISYNSCSDRHCPKCQGPRRTEWLTKRLERLLPVPYFHVVFTLPAELHALALGNKKRIYSILFRAASQALLQTAADPAHLGAQIGVTAILHTWGQNLQLHPHLHCVVTGGGLTPDATRWIPAGERYLLPIDVLGKLFRGKFMAELHRAWKAGQLQFAGSTAELSNPTAWSAFKDNLYRKKWVVYAKPPFGGPEQVFRYLGRYTHRVAISNHRIRDLDDEYVTFTAKDYRHGGRLRTIKLKIPDFLRRFTLHVLPKRFVRIRHYGLHAGPNVNTKLETSRRILHPQRTNNEAAPHSNSEIPPRPWWERFRELTGIDVMACPRCDDGRLQRSPVPLPATRAPPLPA